MYRSKIIYCMLFIGVFVKGYAQTNTVTITDDAVVMTNDCPGKEYQATTPNPNTPWFWAENWSYSSYNTTRQSYMKFDLSVVPAGSVIVSASLYLYGDGYHASTTIGGSGYLANESYLRRITSAWNESTVTWSSMPTSVEANQVLIPSSTTSNENRVVDVKMLVIDMLNDPSSFTGVHFILKIPQNQRYARMAYFSSDAPDVNKRPRLEITYTSSITGSSRICEGTTQTYTTVSAPLTTYSWAVPSGWSTPLGQGTNSITTTAGSLGGDISLMKMVNGVPSTANLAVTVNSNPNINIGSIPSVCYGTTSTSLTYSIAINNPNSYSIDFNAGANNAGFLDVSNAPLLYSMPTPITIPANIAAGTYGGTLTVLDASTGCTSIGHSISLTVNPLPVPSIELIESSGTANDGIICAGESASLASWGGTLYSWSPSTGLSGVNNPAPVATPTSTTTYTLTLTDANSCVATASKTITVNPLPTAAITVTESSGTANDGIICAGASATLTASGGTNYSWSPSTGLSATNIAAPVATPNSNTTYTVTVTNASGCVSTASQTITVNPLPTAAIAVAENSGTANDGIICAGTSAALTASGGTSYSWNPSTGLSATNVAAPVATPTSNTTYTVTVINANGCVSTASQTITVTASNTITLSSVTGTNNQSKCANTAITDITYSTTGATGATFSGLPAGITGVWANDAVTISGTPTVAGTYNYTVALTGGCGIVNATGTIVVRPDYSISRTSASSTVNQNVCVNTAITNITYVTTGAPVLTIEFLPPGVTGEWVDNVVTISGTPTAAGTYTYKITLTGSCNTHITAGTIIVKPLPSAAIAVAESSGTANDGIMCAGASATLTASGGANYFWSPSTGLSATNIAAPVATPTSNTTYTVTVTNASGCIATASQTITVEPLLPVSVAILPDPSNIVCPETSVTYSATPTNGGANPIYQWRVNGAIKPGNGSAFIYSPLNNDIVACELTSNLSCVSGNPATSNTVTMGVTPLPQITVQPTNQAVCEGGDVTFSVAANNASGYQWELCPSGSISWSDIPLATSNAFTVTTSLVMNNNKYRCRVSNSCGIIESDAAVLTFNPPPIITVQPVNQAVCDGGNAVFSVTATNAVGYQWQKFVSGSWADIPSATSANYTVVANSATNGTQYQCVVRNACLTVNSNPATLSLLTAPLITTQPVNQTVCQGVNATFNVQATGCSLTYQWEVSASYYGAWANATGTAYVGATTTNSLTVKGTTTSATRFYRCKISQGANIVYTDVVSLSNILIPTITTQTPTYTNGVPGQSKSISVFPVNLIDWANPVIWSFSGNVTWDVAMQAWKCVGMSALTINANYMIPIDPRRSYTLSVEMYVENNLGKKSGFGGHRYSSTKSMLTSYDFSITQGQVTPTQGQWVKYIIVKDKGKVNGYDGWGVDDCAFYALTGLINYYSGANTQVTYVRNIQFYETPNPISYQWSKDGVTIAGATSPSYTIPVVGIGDEGSYRCTATNGCGSIQSPPIILNASLSINAQPTNATVCQGESSTFSVSANGTNLQYQWEVAPTSSGTWTALNALPAVDFDKPTLTIQGVIPVPDLKYYRCKITDGTHIIYTNPVSLSYKQAPIIISQSPTPIVKEVNTSATITVSGKNGINWTDRSIWTFSGNITWDASKNAWKSVGYSTMFMIAAKAIPIDPKRSYSISVEVFQENNEAKTFYWGGQKLNSSKSQIPGNDYSVCSGVSPTVGQWVKYTRLVKTGELPDLTGWGSGCSYFLAGGLTNYYGVNTQVTYIRNIEFYETGNGLTYHWSKDGVTIPGATSPDLNISNNCGAGAGSYVCTVTAPLCSLSASSTPILFTVTGLTPIDAGSNVSICKGASTMLQPTTPAGGTFVWSPATSLSGVNIKNPTATPQTDITYRLSYTNTNGCTSTDTVKVSVSKGISVQYDDLVCSGEISQVTVSGAPSYKWFPKESFSCSSCANPRIQPLVTSTYRVIGAPDAAGCVDSSRFTVNVQQLPIVGGSEIYSICKGDSVQFQLTYPGNAAKYAWSPKDYLSSSSILNPYAKPIADQKYSLLVTSDANCESSKDIMVKVADLPDLSGITDQTICRGKSATYEIPSVFDRIEWTPVDGISDPNGRSIQISPNVTTNYEVKVWNGSCFSSKTFTVNVLPDIAIVWQINNLSVDFHTSSPADTYFWNFGDNTAPSRLANPTHLYTKAGTYYVRLITRSNCGLKDQTEAIIVVNIIPCTN